MVVGPFFKNWPVGPIASVTSYSAIAGSGNVAMIIGKSTVTTLWILDGFMFIFRLRDKIITSAVIDIDEHSVLSRCWHSKVADSCANKYVFA